MKEEIEQYISVLNAARERVASQTKYKRWENVRQETKGTEDYEEYCDRVCAVVYDMMVNKLRSMRHDLNAYHQKFGFLEAIAFDEQENVFNKIQNVQKILLED